MTYWSALLEVAMPQHGCISRRQLLTLMSRRQLDKAVQHRLLERSHPSVYRLAGTATNWYQRATAATLAVPNSALSHRSAARLWGIDQVASLRINITTFDGQHRRLNDVTVHRSLFDAPHSTVHNGISVTSPARTIIDVATVAPTEKLGAIVDQAFQLGILRQSDIYRHLDEMPGLCRRGLTLLRQVLDQRRIADEQLESHPGAAHYDSGKVCFGNARRTATPLKL